MSEMWMPVPGWEGAYEVSDQGRVRSCDRVVGSKGGTTRRIKGRVLQARFDTYGYPHVVLSVDNRPVTRMVHHLVLEVFAGPRGEGQQARHLDGDKTNNVPSNLAWGTGSENILDQVAHGTHIHARKISCPKGHPLTPDNIVTRPNTNRRDCRTCKRESDRRYQLRKKAS